LVLRLLNSTTNLAGRAVSTVCERCDDFSRTVLLLVDLLRYARRPGADKNFASQASIALAASLPKPFSFPPGYDPTGGPEYPGEES
jgi:hypothetical protein